MTLAKMDLVLLLVVVGVSSIFVGSVCTCLCLASIRFCCTSKSNARPSIHDDRRETETDASLFEETETEGEETVYSQYLTASVHRAVQGILTEFSNEGQPRSRLDRQIQELYRHVLESTSGYAVLNSELRINETHMTSGGTEIATATSVVADHVESHYQAFGDTADRVPPATVSRRRLEVAVASSGKGDGILQASGGTSSSLSPHESNEEPHESFLGGTREPQESRVGNVYQSLENRETICNSTTGTSTHGQRSGSITAEIEVHGSADGGVPDESTHCLGLDASIQKAVRDYFSRIVRDVLQGDRPPSGADTSTEVSSDIDHAVHHYLTSIISKTSLQWPNEPSIESATDNEYITMHNHVSTPKDSSCQGNLNSERKLLVRELPDTSHLAARLSAIRKLPFTLDSRRQHFGERNRSLYVNVKGVKKCHKN